MNKLVRKYISVLQRCIQGVALPTSENSLATSDLTGYVLKVSAVPHKVC